jgi:ATP-dependent helicase/nuclease subunit A
MDGIRNDIEFLDSNNKIEKRVLKSHITFLDWINLVLEKEYKYKDKRFDIDSLVEKNVIEKDSKDQESNSSDEESKKFEIFKKKVNELNLSEEEKNDIIEKISWTYGYTFKSIPSKTSVSEIKRLSLENELDNENDIKEINVKKPKFIEENDENKLTGAEKGSIIHLILQKLDFKENVSKEDIDNLFEELIYKNIIPRNSRGQVNLYNVYKFIESDFYKKISKAKEINKEVPFYINLKIKDVYLNQEIPEDKKDEKVLVQGIIDLYFKDENDKYILVDYKTDYMENNSKEEKDKLVNKYIKQLQIYKNALEDAKQIKIDKIYLYSIYLNEEIEVTL